MRFRLNITALLVAPVLASTIMLAGMQTAVAAELRTSIVVTKDAITLGDLFDDAGNAADVVVAEAPAPGGASDISISRISLAARRNGLAWRNTTGLSHITVNRTGIAVPNADVSAAIVEAIIAKNPSILPTANMQVDFTGGNAGVQVSESDQMDLRVENISFNVRNGNFEALVRAPANNPSAPLRRVYGRAYPVTDVPVLARDVAPGDTVAAADIQWVKMPSSRVSANIVTTQSGLLGMSPRFPVRSGEPLRLSDLQPPVVVAKGAIVDMNYVSGALVLLARGRALEDGAIGDTIDIINPRSNRTVQGVIVGPNAVRIDNLTMPRVQASTTPRSNDVKS